jgi:hypothetical protein
MQTLTIEAASAASARGMIDALSEFRASLVVDETGRNKVVVELGADDREIGGVLNALEQHVTERAEGPARLELEGREYTLHPRPDRGEASGPSMAPA